MKTELETKDDALQEAFELGQEAQQSGDIEAATKAFQEKYGDDPDLHSFFLRGLSAPPVEPRAHKGRLLEHGVARYKNDPSEKVSYFVTLATEKGPETVWGLDLKRAIKKAKLQTGDLAKLENRGKTPVQVKANVKNDEGNIIGSEWKTAEKVMWRASPWDPSLDAAASASSPQSPHLSTSTDIFGTTPPRTGQAANKVIGRVTPHREMNMGTKGAMGLSNMLKSGGQSVQATIASFAYDRANRDFSAAILDAQSQLSELSSGALSAVLDPNIPDTDKQEVVSKFFADPDNRASFETLVSKLDSVQGMSEKLIIKGLDNGLDGDLILEKAIVPINKLLKENEKLLKSLDEGNGSLYDQINNAVTGLFSQLRDLLLRAVDFIANASPHSSNARMGS